MIFITCHGNVHSTDQSTTELVDDEPLTGSESILFFNHYFCIHQIIYLLVFLISL